MIDKTCYFCENLMGKHVKCQEHWKKSSFADNHSVIACKGDFTPNADWLYIEGLHQRIIELEIGEKLIEKENEELKRSNKELAETLQEYNCRKCPNYRSFYNDCLLMNMGKPCMFKDEVKE